MNELEALTVLTATPGLGPVKAKRFLQRYGSAKAVLAASSSDVAGLSWLAPETRDKWKWWEKDASWKTNLEHVERQSISLIPWDSPRFPQPLLELRDHPLLLYVKGNLPENSSRSIAIIGTRTPSIYGREMAEKIAEVLAYKGFTVVSGLARGVDTAAHSGALKGGKTIAVIGSGLANLYPRENLKLSQTIAHNGAVVSEFPMLTPPERHHFPRRNRIVSGMTIGSLLIEAPEKSGAMITMRLAGEQGRKRWALPGRADQGNFKGNHLLIKSGQAALIESADDICGEAGPRSSTTRHAGNAKALEQLDPEERQLLQKMPDNELNIDEILTLTKLPVIKLNILLMSLIMKKMVKEYPGRIYKKQVTSGE